MDRNDSSYIFVSYRRVEREIAHEIVDQLESAGVTCWIDERDIAVGAEWPAYLRTKLRDAAAVLWLKSAACATSEQVLKELQHASRRNQLIIPLQIDDADAEWAPEWDDFVYLLQAIRLSNPTWPAIVSRRILALPGFVAASGPVVAQGGPVGEAASAPGAPALTLGAAEASHPREHVPIVIMRAESGTFQLDGHHGLGESLVDGDDELTTGDPGSITVSSDGAVIATSGVDGEVELWTLGASDSTRGPAIASLLASAGGAPRLIAVDRPLGQAVRVIASAGPVAFSLMLRHDDTWSAMELLRGDQSIVSGASVKDDVLLVRADGATVWASGRSKRPFSLASVHGVDAAVGADGRFYLAAWGTASDASRQVEVVVEADSGWQRVHRGAGRRVGIVRVVPDLVRQRRGAERTTLAVDTGEGTVTVLSLP